MLVPLNRQATGRKTLPFKITKISKSYIETIYNVCGGGVQIVSRVIIEKRDMAVLFYLGLRGIKRVIRLRLSRRGGQWHAQKRRSFFFFSKLSLQIPAQYL